MIAMSAEMIVMSHDLYAIRQIDLFYILPLYDPTGWRKISANVIQGIVHDSCRVTLGKGWYWFARGIGSRNPIDFLIAYYALNFNEAVDVLRKHIGYDISLDKKSFIEGHHADTKISTKTSPEIAVMPWMQLYDYLTNGRHISKETVDCLIESNLAYQTKGHYANICFINKNRNHWEIVGMHPTKKYKQVSDAQNYWAYELGQQRAYICESAIDAISLYELISDRDATYISIAGSVTRCHLIDRIIKEYSEALLGVDNDDAGDKVAGMYPYLQRLKPRMKDFSEDLIKKKGGL